MKILKQMITMNQKMTPQQSKEFITELDERLTTEIKHEAQKKNWGIIFGLLCSIGLNLAMLYKLSALQTQLDSLDKIQIQRDECNVSFVKLAKRYDFLDSTANANNLDVKWSKLR